MVAVCTWYLVLCMSVRGSEIQGCRVVALKIKGQSTKYQVPLSGSLTPFSGSAYSLFALSMTRRHYYYWCACTFAFPMRRESDRAKPACL
jgi:hypothetical protein